MNTNFLCIITLIPLVMLYNASIRLYIKDTYNMTKISKDQPHIFNVEGQIEEL